MRSKLKWVEVEPGLVAIRDVARQKEYSSVYLRMLHLELLENCPVRNQINEQRFPVYKQTGSKRRGDLVITKISDTIPVDHYRRMRRSYFTYGIGGIVAYLREIGVQYKLPEEGTKERDSITPEQLKNYEVISNYFNGLAECVFKGVLPKRDYFII